MKNKQITGFQTPFNKLMQKVFLTVGLLFIGVQAQANTDVTCILENCLTEGWHVYNTNTGASSLTTCIDGDCDLNGWDYTVNNRLTSETICKPEGCFTEGWLVYDSRNRVVADVTCHNSFAGSDCLQFGWTTFEPGRGSYVSRCINGDCRNIGWDVLVNGYAPQAVRCKRGGCFNIGWTAYN